MKGEVRTRNGRVESWLELDRKLIRALWIFPLFTSQCYSMLLFIWFDLFFIYKTSKKVEQTMQLQLNTTRGFSFCLVNLLGPRHDS